MLVMPAVMMMAMKMTTEVTSYKIRQAENIGSVYNSLC